MIPTAVAVKQNNGGADNEFKICIPISDYDIFKWYLLI